MIFNEYYSEELSIPEEREADEYVYSDRKEDQEIGDSEGVVQQEYYSDEESAPIQPLNIDELEHLYADVHGTGDIQV